MLKQNLQFKLSQKLSPQQIQLMKLIQLPTQAFEQRLKEEMNENPALESGKEEEDNYEADEFETNEFDDYDDASNIDTDDISIDDYLSNDEIPDYKLQANNYAEEDQRESPLSAALSFHQDLVAQLNTFILTDEEREIAEFLVGSIDEMGYIRRSLADIVDDLAFTQAIYTDEKTVERILHLVHELEPAGIGAGAAGNQFHVVEAEGQQHRLLQPLVHGPARRPLLGHAQGAGVQGVNGVLDSLTHLGIGSGG